MIREPQHILCAVDLSAHTGLVLRWGDWLARTFGARLNVFHAVNPVRQDPFPGTTIFERSGQLADLLSLARRQLAAAVAPFEKIQSCQVVAGDPVETLVEFSRKAGVDLVVAASHGFSGIRRVLLGTVVERLARQLEGPLLVLRVAKEPPSADLGFKRIVVACDSPTAPDEAVGYAVAFTRRCGARLFLLHAMALPVMPDLLDPTDGPYAEVQTALEGRLHECLWAMLAAQGVDPSAAGIALRHGAAPEILPDYIRDVRADLAVVGVHACPRLKKLIIGSTTEAALRHAPCAVLTVPVPAADASGSRPLRAEGR
ncbi:MAG: universal stress protein [Desulfobacteraceae bacterium]|jgi:nucleotide-binding universal stress UspA family protein|nr:universal stress protein [Desulfobacteraceae bacterium]